MAEVQEVDPEWVRGVSLAPVNLHRHVNRKGVRALTFASSRSVLQPANGAHQPHSWGRRGEGLRQEGGREGGAGLNTSHTGTLCARGQGLALLHGGRREAK